MKRESRQTIEYEQRINLAFEEFSKVPKEKGPEFSNAARTFFDSVSTSYFEYLALAWRDKLKDRPELLGDAYIASFAGEENLLRIAANYDGRDSFFKYLDSCVYKRIQGVIEKNDIDARRMGITKAFRIGKSEC